MPAYTHLCLYHTCDSHPCLLLPSSHPPAAHGPSSLSLPQPFLWKAWACGTCLPCLVSTVFLPVRWEQEAQEACDGQVGCNTHPRPHSALSTPGDDQWSSTQPNPACGHSPAFKLKYHGCCSTLETSQPWSQSPGFGSFPVASQCRLLSWGGWGQRGWVTFEPAHVSASSSRRPCSAPARDPRGEPHSVPVAP